MRSLSNDELQEISAGGVFPIWPFVVSGGIAITGMGAGITAALLS